MSAPGSALVTSPSPTSSPQYDHRLRHRITAWAGAHAALIVLLLAPFALFGIPELFGRVFLYGDNFIQNFPLRVLVGHDLQHARLPLWNPYLFSGTPLLAGFNAGAAFPATWLMAVLPIFTAWALSVAAVYDLALVGMYLFLRRQGICRASSTFGAATFAFAGFMSAQLEHVDLIQGAACLPWMLLAVHGLTGQAGDGAAGPVAVRAGLSRVRGWVALLAVAFGLSLLSGGVEATIDGLVVVVIYWGGRLVALGYLRRPVGRALLTPVAAFVLGLAGAAALGTAQWLSGASFVSHSQRAGSSYAFFTSGSLPGRLLTLLASPFALGTYQDQPGYYAGPYNFAEVTGYVGILALMAACVLLVRRWRTRPEARHWYVWYVVLVVGLLSALGNQTYFGRVLYVVPGLNSERLLNRNLLLVDCSLAVLLAWWTHLLTTDRGPAVAGAGSVATVRGWWREGRRAELVATCAPFVLIVLVCVALWVAGPLLDRFLETPVPVPEDTRRKVAVLVTGGALIAAAATWIVLAEARFSALALRRLLAGVLVADLALFNVFVIRPPITEAGAKAQGTPATAFKAIVGDGRFIIFDPDRFYADQLQAIGQTDLNIFTGLLSAQGYTALTDEAYYRATGAHLQEDLDPTTLAGPVWDNLNVTTLLSVPSYFVTPVPSSSPPAGYPFPSDALTGRPVPGGDGPFSLARGSARRWYFGGVLTVQHWSLPLDDGAGNGLRAGLVSIGGRLQWLPPSDLRRSGPAHHRTVEVSLPAPVAAGGVVIQAGASGDLSVGAPDVVTAEAGAVRLDGRLQTVADPHWAFTGALGSFGVFHNADARGWAWLASPGGGPAAAGSVVSAPATGFGSASASGPGDGQDITVHATGAVVLDRSESWSPGWHATVRALSSTGSGRSVGPPVATAVTRNGLIQQVAISRAGDYRVSFTYAPTSARVGIVVSASALAALAVWGVAEVARGRRRRRRGRRAAAAGPPELSRG